MPLPRLENPLSIRIWTTVQACSHGAKHVYNQNIRGKFHVKLDGLRTHCPPCAFLETEETSKVILFGNEYADHEETL